MNLTLCHNFRSFKVPNYWESMIWFISYCNSIRFRKKERKKLSVTIWTEASAHHLLMIISPAPFSSKPGLDWATFISSSERKLLKSKWPGANGCWSHLKDYMRGKKALPQNATVKIGIDPGTSHLRICDVIHSTITTSHSIWVLPPLSHKPLHKCQKCIFTSPGIRVCYFC